MNADLPVTTALHALVDALFSDHAPAAVGPWLRLLREHTRTLEAAITEAHRNGDWTLARYRRMELSGLEIACDALCEAYREPSDENVSVINYSLG